MSVRAQLSVTDQRRAARHPVDYPVIAEHHDRGDVKMHISNISAHGFMVDDGEDLSRGDRVIIRLPIIGRIEAYVIWVREERAGFQFERIIRLDDFDLMIDTLQPNSKLTRRR
uniref:PilZ domain-containing protein n=1 Tax=Parerythrobacter lutipelagi TaxID=1964208 RepID=UPI0010F96DF4|nr:PilZ domain-containing protein [Parerythrobacter lutipelagi]